jgi:hypothetical protein
MINGVGSQIQNSLRKCAIYLRIFNLILSDRGSSCLESDFVDEAKLRVTCLGILANVRT